MNFTLLAAWAALALAGGLLAAPPAPADGAPAPHAVSAALPIPSRLTATGRSGPIGSQVQLSWVPPPRTPGYKVYRDGQFLAPSSRPSWTDYNVAAGETHAYTVTSLGATGESRPSPQAKATVPAGGGQVVYADALQNGWQSWSWAAADLGSASPVRAGCAIRVTAGPWQALYLHHAPFSTSAYAAVTFWIHGGTQGGQRLCVKALRSGVPQAAVPLGPLPAGQWQSVTVSLHDLGVVGVTDMDGLWVQDASGTMQPAFSVDEIALTAATATPPASPAPAAPAGLTATPQWAASCPVCGGMAMPHIVLAWNAVPGASSYTVYRDGAKAQDGLASLAWTDMSVVSGQAYVYTVTATGPGGEGAHSFPATATAPEPPAGQAVLTAPTNLCAAGVWAGAPTDHLAWSPVPGAVSYNVYQYDAPIAKGLTAPSFSVPPAEFFESLTYAVTAVDGMGMESLPSAITTAQGALAPGQRTGWGPPQAPTNLVATPEWNVGAPRVHLSWYGWDSAFTYNVYRDGRQVASGLWGMNYYDQDVRPGASHTYTVSGVNVPASTPVESAQSAAARATAPTSAPAAAPGPVQITAVQPDDDSAVVSFAAVPGAADYRVYSLASPNTVKYSGGGLSVEMNGLDPVAGADLVVEAVDKLGPFQKMDGMAGPGAMTMDGMHQAINGQGDPSDVPNVLAASAPVHVALQPRTLSGSQVFFDNFRGEQPLVLQPMPAPTGNPNDSFGQFGNYWEMANDKWRIRNYVGDVVNTKAFFMGSHFMDTLYDGGTPPAGPMHNNDASLVMMPRATADISGGGVLHVTFEVDAHFDSRRWCDLIVAPASATLLNPGAKAGTNRTFSGTGTAFRWRIQYENNAPEMVSQSTDAPPLTLEDFLFPVNGMTWDVAHSAARLDPYQHMPQANGTAQDLDKRHRFDLYLSRTHFRVMEQGAVAWEGDIPVAQAMPAGPYQVYLVHQLYHTGNDRNELVDWDPQDTYWYNHRPWCDERHWDNCGQEVLTAFPPLP